MTQALRFLRPAGGLLAAGFLIPVLFLPPRTTLFQEPVPSTTCTVTVEEPPTSATASPTEDLAAPSATPSPTVGLTESPDSTVTPTHTPTSTDMPTATAEPIEATATASESSTATATDTAAPTPLLPIVPAPHDPMALVLNEIAWSGTAASSNDEWIELFNPGPSPIDLDGWRLTDGGDVHVALQGSIPAFGFFLLERTDDSTISNIAADQIYTGALSNSGESLELLDSSGSMIDSANADGGGWPAGNVANHTSMERLAGPDGPGAWRTFTGCWSLGADAAGEAVSGTPRGPNSLTCPSPTESPTPIPAASTPTPTRTPTTTPSPNLTPVVPQTILINEVAWSGTEADSSDEWIELHNPGPVTIELRGWQLTDDGDLHIALRGSLPPYGFYLLERTNDQTVADIAADQVYSGGLNNSGESLRLLDPSGTVVDSANADGGGWAAGDDASRRSMERRGGDDHAGNWGTFPGYGGVGHDAAGNSIAGTPRHPNAVNQPVPTATHIPSRVVINEVLIRPHYDWEGTGGVTPGDEFIELYNAGNLPVHLLGWMLDDVEGAGSKPYVLPDTVLQAHDYLAFFRTRTNVALNDTGDAVRLLEPGGRVIDQISYLKVRASNLSYGRLPDGGHHLLYGLWPTAGSPNQLFVEPKVPLPIVDSFTCPAGHLHPLLYQLPNHPLAILHASTALLVCP